MKRPVTTIAHAALFFFLTIRLAPAQQAPTPAPGDMGEIIRLDPALDKIIPPGSKIEKVPGSWGTLEGARTEGPVWTRDGNLLFSETAGNVIYKLDGNDKSSVYRERSGWVNPPPGGGLRPGSNGLTLDKEGRLLVCEMGNRRITRIEKDGKVTVLADKFEGKRLNRPNDIVVKSDGSIYFTDTQTQGEESEIPHQSVFRIAPDGKLQLLISDINPNGIAFSPDEKLLYVTAGSKWLRYPVNTDGTLGTPSLVLDVTAQRTIGPGGVDGMKVDKDGNLIATGPGGIWIISPEGKPLGRIRLPVYPMNEAFGGKDGKTLYMTAWTSIYRIRMANGGKLP